MKLICSLTVALIATSGAFAAPEGFRDSFRLTMRAKAINGNEDAVVYCARTIAAYEEMVDELLGPNAPSPRAFAIPTMNSIYLYNSTCLTLENWIRGKPVSPYSVGVEAHTLAHETQHLAGVTDEQEAECSSLRTLSETLRRHFAVKRIKTNRAMVAAAKTRNRLSLIAC